MAELTNYQKLKALPWQLAGHVLTTVFIRTDFYGGSMFMLFLSELKLDKCRIGFLMSLLTAFGLFGLFCAPLTARIGFKRSYMSFVIGRLFFVSPLLLLPFIVNNYGGQYGFWLLVGSMSCFAINKTFGEVAWVPWTQEVVPDAVRGKFAALVNIGTMLSSIIITAIGGYLIGEISGLTPFMIMIYMGIFAGIISVGCYAKMPGGDPIINQQNKNTHFKEMIESLTKDRNYLCYNIALAIVFIGFNIASTFVALFLKEEVGLSSKIIVWLDIANFGGSMISCYFWGWSSDRFGSKPVMLMGPIIWLLFPIICILIPYHSILSIPMAFIIEAVLGIGGMGWILGINRYLYVTAMPAEKRTGYSAVYYTNQMIAICLGPLISGLLIDKMSSMRTWLEQYSIQPYTPIFILGFFFMLCGVIIMGKVRCSNDMPLLRFIKLFTRIDTLKSCFLIIMYRFTIREEKRIILAMRLGVITNPLVSEELNLLKNDPSFDVRFAALFAKQITHIRGSWQTRVKKLAVCDVRDKIKAVNLWQNGNSYATKYASSLLMNDKELTPFKDVPEPIQIKNAVAIAQFNNEQSLPHLASLINTAEKDELTGLIYFAAKISGYEDKFYSYWKKLQHDSGTNAANIFWEVRNEFEKSKTDSVLIILAEKAAEKYAKNEYIDANKTTAQIASSLFNDDNQMKDLIEACISKLQAFDCIETASLALIFTLINKRLRAIKMDQV